MADQPQQQVPKVYPPALQPTKPLVNVNEAISLYCGPIEFTQQQTSLRGDGNVDLVWLPTPTVRFEVPDISEFNGLDLSDVELRLTDGTKITHGFITRMNPGFALLGDHKAKLSGIIAERVIRPKDGAASYGSFHVANFEDVRGRPVAEGKGWRCARTLLKAAGWCITLDEVRDFRQKKEELRLVSGFAVTHIGRLEKEDGTTFTAKESWELLDAVGWYLSFCCGRWTGPGLLCGFDEQSQLLWEVWEQFRTVPYRDRHSWADKVLTGCVELPFAGFLKLWQDETWEEVIRVAIHWYLEANAQAGSIEGSIVLTQTAFELLSSAVLVDSHGWLSTDGYEKLPAADRIRLLFQWASIPVGIPPTMAELTAAAKADNWHDIPAAMTMVRNTITHPTKKNREKYQKHPNEVRTAVWWLGLWALELCLLRLFGYSGHYGNRITQRYVGEVENVPWVKPNS
jgi:hypothetical protein